MATISTNGSSTSTWGATSSWAGGRVPGIRDTANVIDQILLDASYNVGAVTGTAAILSNNNDNRLMVGGDVNGVQYIIKGISA